MIKISAVVCTYNRAQLLFPCLQSLANQSLDKSSYEVIVVDNNSSDNTPVIIAEFTSRYSIFRGVREEKSGRSHARNRGYLEAQGLFVAYIDDDAQADEFWLEKIVHAFEKTEPAPSVVGGKIAPYYLSEKPEWFLDVYETHNKYGERAGFLKGPHAQYGFAGANMAFPRTILKQYNGFSPEFGGTGSKIIYGEEVALCYRIYQDRPYFWYDPEIRVRHFVPRRNMSLRFILKRNFSATASLTLIEGQKTSIFTFMYIMSALVGRALLLMVSVRWFNQYWRRDFIKYGVPLACSAGKFMALVLRKVPAKM